MTPAASLLGLGTAAPRGSHDHAALAPIAAARCCGNARERNWLGRIYRHSGVERFASVLLEHDEDSAAIEAFYPAPRNPADRGPTTETRLARYAAEASALGERACRAALADAALGPEAITHIVTVSCTGLMSPGPEIELIARLGLSPDIGRLNLGFMGCHGAFNGLRAAQALVQNDPDARVLMCCVELCTLHFQYGWNTERVVANALFADGAGALVVGPQRNGCLRLRGTASRIAPDSHDAMTWRIGDHGFKMGLARSVPQVIRSSLADWLSGALAAHGSNPDAVRHWAVHPGGPRIIESVREALALPEAASSASTAVLAAHGNMSSATVLFVLKRLREQGAVGPCVALGFGPGLAFEAALLEFPAD